MCIFYIALTCYLSNAFKTWVEDRIVTIEFIPCQTWYKLTKFEDGTDTRFNK